MSRRIAYPTLDLTGTTVVQNFPISGTTTTFGNPLGTVPAVSSALMPISGAYNIVQSNGMEFMDMFAYQMSWSGAFTGTFSIEASLDFDPQRCPNATGTWSAIGISPLSQPSGSAGSAFINVDQVATPWVRWKYVHTAGSGTITVWSCQRGIG